MKLQIGQSSNQSTTAARKACLPLERVQQTVNRQQSISDFSGVTVSKTQCCDKKQVCENVASLHS